MKHEALWGSAGDAFHQTTKVENPDKLRRKVAHGDAEAQYKLGDFYNYGHGVEQDSEKAFILYRKSAKQGHEPARKYIDSNQPESGDESVATRRD